MCFVIRNIIWLDYFIYMTFSDCYYCLYDYCNCIFYQEEKTKVKNKSRIIIVFVIFEFLAFSYRKVCFFLNCWNVIISHEKHVKNSFLWNIKSCRFFIFPGKMHLLPPLPIYCILKRLALDIGINMCLYIKPTIEINMCLYIKPTIEINMCLYT